MGTERYRSYAQSMYDHVVTNEAGWYLPWTKGEHHLRRALLWLSGLAAIVVGAAMAVIGNSSSPYSALDSAHLSIPLGITLVTLGVILFSAYVIDRVSRRKKNKSVSVSAEKEERQLKSIGKVTVKDSIATELALLAELYSRGALSSAEFDAAKRRLLDD